MSSSTSALKRISSLQGWLCALALGLAPGCAEVGAPEDASDGGTSGARTGTTSTAPGGADGGSTGTSGSTSTGTTSSSSTGTTSTGGTATTSTGDSGGTSNTNGSTNGTGTNGSTGDASTTGSADPDGGVPPRPDAGDEDPFAGLFGDGGLFGGPAPSMDPDDSMPPPAGDGEWTLNPDSAAECPEEPPPIPLLGGACLGIYYACGWTNQSGASYSCICDWVHWLCI